MNTFVKEFIPLIPGLTTCMIPTCMLLEWSKYVFEIFIHCIMYVLPVRWKLFYRCIRIPANESLSMALMFFFNTIK